MRKTMNVNKMGLLPPRLEERRSDRNVWMSDVIPAFQVRPARDDKWFMGFQLLLFAHKTKRHIVYDAQVDYGQYERTSTFGCRMSCMGSCGCLCSGRVDLKDNFLKRLGTGILRLQFFEDGVVWASPSDRDPDDLAYPIAVYIARGYDSVKKPGEGAGHNGISFGFGEVAKLARWMDAVNGE